MNVIRRIVKLFLCIGSILIYLIITSLLRPSHRILARLNMRLAGFLCNILGIKIVVKGDKPVLNNGCFFIVSNHLSYIDGIVLGSLFPLIYVSRISVKNWPLFGQMASAGGTIFINRNHKLKTPEYVGKIAGLLKKQINVLVFPEGTSSDGRRVLPFQSVFFYPAIISNVAILPLTISYEQINSQRISEANKDKIYWYGDMLFMNHFCNLLGIKRINVCVNIHPEIEPLTYNQADSGRKELSKSVHSVISRVFSGANSKLIR